jgi:hypothetical protein
MKAADIICVALLGLLAPLFGFAQEATQSDVESLLNRIETAYSAVANYQVNVEVRDYRPGAEFETKKFLYTYKKKPGISGGTAWPLGRLSWAWMSCNL